MSKKNTKFKFIDLFAGIGGFHIAIHTSGGKCVYESESDKSAKVTYEDNCKRNTPELFLNGNFNADLNNSDPIKIPDFDILCTGFPCQLFSIVGKKGGFEDIREILFVKN